MKFGSLFENTISSLKKASLTFWIMCFVVSILGFGSEFMSMDFNVNDNNSYLSSEIEIDNYFTEDELAEYYEVYGDFDTYSDDYLDDIEDENIIEDFDFDVLNFLKEASIILIPLIVIGFLLMMLIINLIASIINYYFMAFAIESVDGKEISKGKNIGKVILAQILLSLIMFIPILICIVFVVLAISLGNIILILPGILILLFGILYLSMRYSLIYYIAVKYQELNAREILQKSAEITRGNILKMFLYTILIGLIFGFIISLPVNFASSLLISLSPVIGACIYFIISVVLNTVYTAFVIMFNVNMYKALDSNL